LLDSLIESLKTGFIDHQIKSNNQLIPQVLVNNYHEGKKVLTTIKKELLNCDEFWLSVAFVTTSGVAVLINTLDELQKKNIKGKILVSKYQNFTQPEALKRLLMFNNIELRIAVLGNFHSKGYLFKKDNYFNLIIGSSNLTSQALCSNVELNLKVTASEKSAVIKSIISEFKNEFEKAEIVNNDFILKYTKIYYLNFHSRLNNDTDNLIVENRLCSNIKQIEYDNGNENSYFLENVADSANEYDVYHSQSKKNAILFQDYISFEEDDEDSIVDCNIKPNKMQVEALKNISNLRDQNKKKALLISATGTGKTFLSAFDVKRVNPKRLLFIVHRLNIAQAAMKSYRLLFAKEKTMGLYSGNYKESSYDFIFSTVQTISKTENLTNFSPTDFEYIVIDETHRAGAESYSKVLEYFKPNFLLGMTATPERTDGADIFKLFDYNIAYEIRLHKAMEENMLSTFHYYGITDIKIDGVELDENSTFKSLICEDRVKHILARIQFYGTDSGIIRGLVFCSRIEECQKLSEEFNKHGYKTVALSGNNSDQERNTAIERLESNDQINKLDYIFTVDIFNEGVDIPKVNQIVMLRPTQSAIVFVQQLGRGLRRLKQKSYLTVIDFIANYSNNYLVPIALYGDTSFNKDSLRKLMASDSSLLPGASTINFDLITKERIYKAIDTANMQVKRELISDYNLLKFKIGRIPMMIDFIEHGSRDPQLYVNRFKSYYNFVYDQEMNFIGALDVSKRKLLELFSNEINNSKRVEESIILKELLGEKEVTVACIRKIIQDKYEYIVSDETIYSCINNLNFEFINESNGKKFFELSDNSIKCLDIFKQLINNEVFGRFFQDSIEYSIQYYDGLFHRVKFIDGFVLYRKYSRKDVFRILNWSKNPIAQGVGGYMLSRDNKNCAIFVNYHKADNISDTTKYDDKFLNNMEFEWMTKSNRSLKSREVQAIRNYRKTNLRMPLFIKKHNDEGIDFYYMGDVTPIGDNFEQKTMPDGKGGSVPVVKILFSMKIPVEENIFNYITNF